MNYSIKTIVFVVVAACCLVVSGCSKEPSGSTSGVGQTSDCLLGSWEMQLAKSYVLVTEYDDKKGVDAVTGATESGDEGGTVAGATYMDKMYSAAGLSFENSGTAVRSYTRDGSTTTTTMSYTRDGNILQMGGTKCYITKLEEHKLTLETYRIYLAKGKDVYEEFMHLEYTR